jgi:transcriptional regulator with XRE-family HTH domain
LELYLEGKSVPGERELARIAGALGVTPDWLLGDDESFRRNKGNILSFAGRLDGTGKLWFISKGK